MKILNRFFIIFAAVAVALFSGTLFYCLASLDASTASSASKLSRGAKEQPLLLELDYSIEIPILPLPPLDRHPAVPNWSQLNVMPIPVSWLDDDALPDGYYILIDTSTNRLSLKYEDRTVATAICSTGSERRLRAGDREWVFKTPRGKFHILSKVPNPVWRKPDWAFIEEGEPIPQNEYERFESGVLGEYALAIGDGYYIHGTLYENQLGQSVTHGCIRLGSEDLIFLAETVPPGTPVFIY